MKALLIQAEYSPDVIELQGDPAAVKRVLSAEELAEKCIWKYRQPIGTMNPTDAVAIADADGYAKGLRPNLAASDLLARLGTPVKVAGPVLICGRRNGEYVDCPPGVLRDSGKDARPRTLSSPFAKRVLSVIGGFSFLAIVGAIMSAHADSNAKDQYGYPMSSHRDGVKSLVDVGMTHAQAECTQSYFESLMSYSDWLSYRKDVTGYKAWLEQHVSPAYDHCG